MCSNFDFYLDIVCTLMFNVYEIFPSCGKSSKSKQNRKETIKIKVFLIRVGVGYLVNIVGFLLVCVTNRDTKDEAEATFALFCFIVVYTVCFYDFITFMIVYNVYMYASNNRTISDGTEDRYMVIYRCLEIVFDIMVLIYSFILSGWEMTEFTIATTALSCADIGINFLMIFRNCMDYFKHRREQKTEQPEEETNTGNQGRKYAEENSIEINLEEESHEEGPESEENFTDKARVTIFLGRTAGKYTRNKYRKDNVRADETGTTKKQGIMKRLSEKIKPNRDSLRSSIQSINLDNEEITQTFRCENIELFVTKGDISEFEADVIVVSNAPTNKILKAEASSIFSAVMERGGENLELEYEEKIKDGVEYGQMVTTFGCRLTCQHIYFVCLKPWDASTGISRQILQDLMKKCLQQTIEHRSKEIAFPSLGTGSLGFPTEIMANVMVDSIRSFAEDHPKSKLKKIYLVVFNKSNNCEKEYKAICREFSEEERTVFPEVDIIVGDLLKQQTDVIVADITLNMDLELRHFSKEIRKSWNTNLMTHWAKHYGNGIAAGKVAVFTQKCGLKCKNVFFGPIPKCEEANNAKQILSSFIQRCLKKAFKYDFNSISFSTFSLDCFYPIETVANTFKDCVHEFKHKYKKERKGNFKIKIVIPEQSENADDEEKVLRKYFPNHLPFASSTA